MKKVILKESQVRSLIDKIISEQNTNKSETLNVDFGKQLWPQGKWKLTSAQSQNMTPKVDQILEFAKKHKGSQVVIQIESGESQVTNYDAELPDKKEVDPGYLSNKRGEEMVKYLTALFKRFKEEGLISQEPEIPSPKTKIGGTKYIKYSAILNKAGTNKKDHEFYLANKTNYDNEQFVRAVISLKKDYKCLIGMEVTIGYFREKDELGRVSKSNHFCDEAIFELKMNGVSLGLVNLNNHHGDLAAYYASGGGDQEEFDISFDLFLGIGQDSMGRRILDPKGRLQRDVYQQLKTKKEKRERQPDGTEKIVEPGPRDTIINFLKDVYNLTPDRYTDNLSGGTRYKTFKITPELAQSIAGESEEIVLSIVPLVSEGGKYDLLYQNGSHSDTPYVTIKDKDNNLLYNDEPNIKLQRGSTAETVLLRTDRCGNPPTAK